MYIGRMLWLSTTVFCHYAEKSTMERAYDEIIVSMIISYS